MKLILSEKEAQELFDALETYAEMCESNLWYTNEELKETEQNDIILLKNICKQIKPELF